MGIVFHDSARLYQWFLLDQLDSVNYRLSITYNLISQFLPRSVIMANTAELSRPLLPWPSP